MAEPVFVPAWQKNNPALEADAIGFWKAHDMLPAGVDPAARAKDLCGLLRKEGKVIAVSTATIRHMPRFRCRMALYRCAAAPSMRRRPHSKPITEGSRDLLERWALDHPEEKVMAMAAVVESTLLLRQMPSVFWPSGLVFAGYTPGGQPLYVSWFRHATTAPGTPRRRHGFGQVPQPDA